MCYMCDSMDHELKLMCLCEFLPYSNPLSDGSPFLALGGLPSRHPLGSTPTTTLDPCIVLYSCLKSFELSWKGLNLKKMLGEGHMVFEFSQLLSPHPFLSTYNCYSWQSSVMFWNFTERVAPTEVGIFWYFYFIFNVFFSLNGIYLMCNDNTQSWS